MATNVKAKKKTGTYDNKLIFYIAGGLLAFVLICVAVFVIVTASTNYAAKVDGQKIYDYEYRYYLMNEISEYYNDNFEEPEGYDDLSSDEQQKLWDAFFTDDVKATVEANALEEARKFKAEYRMAVKKGYKLTSTEKASVKSNIDYYVSMYVSYYGLSQDQAEYYITQGTMKLSEYKKFMIQIQAIEKYKNALKETYTVTDDEMRAIYDEAPDDYRTISGRVFKFSLPTKPNLPVDNDGNPVTADTEDEELKAKYDEYQKSLADYEASLPNYEKLANEMLEALNTTGKFTLYDYDMVSYEIKKEKDDDGNETDKDAVKAENADFETLCTSQSAWSNASTNLGVISVNNGSSSGVEEIDELLITAQWNDARNRIAFVEKASEDDAEENADDVANAESDDSSADKQIAVFTEIRLVKVTDEDGNLTGLYLVRAEGIDDFDSDPEEDAELNTIKSNIKATVLEDKAVADLEAKVEKAGSKYALKSKNKKVLKKIMKAVLG